MKICGIVCEYNPFHLGHLHQINCIRERLGQDTVIVCCMSGNFVQRGEGALTDKHSRAKMAILGGADLVVELPTPYALSSAEGFARGAVAILSALGATHIAFGAEHAQSDDLMEIAAILLEKSTIESTIAHMSGGISYAKARERALFDIIRERSEMISKPNNILAVEYCKAVLSMAPKMLPVAIARVGAAHDGGAEGDLASASHIRELVRAGEIEQAARFLPWFSYEILREGIAQGRVLLNFSRMECAMLSRLLQLEVTDLAQQSGASEGLEHRLYAAIHKGRGVGEICALAKTRRYAASRLRRMIMCAYLGITAREVQGLPLYIKVLGLREKGRLVLSQKRESCPMTIVTKPADGKEFLQKEAIYTDLYNLALDGFADISSGSEWKSGVFYEKQENC